MYFLKKRYAQCTLYRILRSCKSNLTVCKVTFYCKLQKKIGEQDVGLLVAPPIILLREQLLSLLWEQLLPLLPSGSRTYGY